MPVQRPHHADPGEHRRPVMFRDQYQRLHRDLRFVGGLRLTRELVKLDLNYCLTVG